MATTGRLSIESTEVTNHPLTYELAAGPNASLDGFKIAVPEDVLDDLRARLRRTRFPSHPLDRGWHYGTSLEYMSRLVKYWLDGYDWRAVESRLNRLPQYLATVSGYRIHVIHERGSGPKSVPLVITHGWPGSFLEFEAVIGPLAHPERFGGEIDDAFDVILPSIPGYGWSSAPEEPITTRDVAHVWDELLTGPLGYRRFFAQGGDWGSLVSTWLGVDHPDHVPAIHLNMAGVRPFNGEGSPPLTAEEEDWAARAREQLRREVAYQAIQGTKPQTLAYGLSDSPVGLAAWIVEKFHGWSDPDASEPPFSFDQLISNVMIYWLTNCAHPASWLYTAVREGGGDMRLGRNEFVTVPTGLLTTPHDLFPPPPRGFVERSYNCIHRTDLSRGGHFIAFEGTDDFVDDVRDFFRPHRSRFAQE